MTVRMLIDYDGGAPFFGPGWDPGDFNPANFADVRLIWDGCDEALMSFDMLGDFLGDWSEHQMQLERITNLEGFICL